MFASLATNSTVFGEAGKSMGRKSSSSSSSSSSQQADEGHAKIARDTRLQDLL